MYKRITVQVGHVQAFIRVSGLLSRSAKSAKSRKGLPNALQHARSTFTRIRRRSPEVAEFDRSSCICMHFQAPPSPIPHRHLRYTDISAFYDRTDVKSSETRPYCTSVTLERRALDVTRNASSTGNLCSSFPGQEVLGEDRGSESEWPGHLLPRREQQDVPYLLALT